MFVLFSVVRVGNIAWCLNKYPLHADGANFILEHTMASVKKRPPCSLILIPNSFSLFK